MRNLVRPAARITPRRPAAWIAKPLPHPATRARQPNKTGYPRQRPDVRIRAFFIAARRTGNQEPKGRFLRPDYDFFFIYKKSNGLFLVMHCLGTLKTS
jgi:hypothetical protein